MSKNIVTNEMIYFTGKAERKRDFSGPENSMNEQERIEFLQKYQEKARKWHNDTELNQKVVSDEEVSAFLDTYKARTGTKVRKTIYFDRMQAREVYKSPEYKNLHLYVGTKVVENELVFPSRKTRPTPCALYEVDGTEKMTVGFDVFVSKDFKCTQDGHLGTAQSARTIELRTKTVRKLEIKLYNSGEIACYTHSLWTPSETLLGDVRYGEWNEIFVEIDGDVSVTVNGKKTENISVADNECIDNIFFDGGLFPREEWKVRNFTVNGNRVVFTENNEIEKVVADSKEVTVPYAIGTYEKRDRRLYLKKAFDIDEYKEAYLNIQTLDPGGKAWINGQQVLDTDTFTANRICISKWLKKGENVLEIMVEPRAPEVRYYWHRHTDCYNGWYCGEVSVELTDAVSITDIRVTTREVSPKVKADVTVTLNDKYNGTVKLYAQKCYPECEEEFLLCSEKICGDKFDVSISENLQLWDDKNPNLYNIRAVLCNDEGTETDDYIVETGFRTIEQKNGSVYLNNNKIMLNGALTMQFLPPFDEVPVNHNCPSDWQIAWQAMMLKAMNGNMLRLHMLGCGTNEPRYARICDRLGVMLIWTSRFIDTLEELVWDDGYWHEREEYLEQVKSVANYPSVIMHEGSNEYHPKDLDVIDRIYDSFVDGVKSVDDTRLLTPCSHLYYGGGIYDIGCVYYSDNGLMDEKGNAAKSGHGWIDKDVIRSTHTYRLLCGYGDTWEKMRKQSWQWQQEMLDSKDHSYLITEYAVTALPNPTTPEELANEYVESYERKDEIGAIGRWFEQSEWRESQGYQALCASQGIKNMRKLGADGLLWCCLISGANNGSYMKPPIDFYGYKKLGFYALRDGYRPIYAAKEDVDLSYGTDDAVSPMILCSNTKGKYDLKVSVLNDSEEVVDTFEYKSVEVENENVVLKPFKPNWTEAGYYTLKFELIPIK